MSVLDNILAHKRTEIERLDLADLRRRAMDAPAPRDFAAALTPIRSPSPEPTVRERGRGGPAGAGVGVRAVRLIAELKRASPSRGLLAPSLDMMDLARIYCENGASAISVLTDERFFLGSLNTLYGLRFTHFFPLPLLRKDFILCPAQVYETRVAGADAMLLITAALPGDAEFADLHALALELGLTPLVEVHTLEELERALRLPGLTIVGVNNRDLRTFEVSLENTAGLRAHVPEGVRVVSESGIFTREHTARLAALGVDAVLVGEALVTAEDIGAKVRELSGS